MNNRGQFSIIAALFVAVVLVSSVMVTYSSIRYSSSQSEPQALSAIDETNLALKQVLGFTVGYYGSVLQVTGNSSYARTLATNYLDGGLRNIADIRPEWGSSFTVNNLALRTNWFTNSSFSEGNITVTYALAGLGISGVTYSSSCRLDVRISGSSSSSQVRLSVFKDENQPLNDLGKQQFRFYRYRYSNLTWELVTPTSEPLSFANGTYLIDVPSEINPYSYAIQVADTRGITVVASSYSHYTASLLFNSTYAEGDYVDNVSDVDSSSDKGTHSNFAAQQTSPDGVYDVLTEANVGTVSQDYFPSASVPLNSTTLSSGSLSDLQTDNGVYMRFNSYGSAFSGSATFGYSTGGGNTASIENNIRGSVFQVTTDGQAQSISVYLTCTNRIIKAAIYSDDHTLIATTEEKTVTASNAWVTFNFANPKPRLSTNTNYVLVAWSDSGSGNVNMYYTSGSSNQGHRLSRTYGSWPSSASFNHEDRRYSIYCTYAPANQYTCEIEFSGWSDTNNWNNLFWVIDSSATTTDVNAVFQLFNFQTGQYAASGDGYLTATLGTTDTKKNQTLTENLTQFRDVIGGWKLKVTAVKSTSSQFGVNIDLITFRPGAAIFALDLEEQWSALNVTYMNPRPTLCIKTGPSSLGDLKVDVWYSGSWRNVLSGLVSNSWNNVSVAPYLDSSIFTIRFFSNTDMVQSNWQIDSVLLRPESDQGLFTGLSDPSATVAVEVLQNGTMRWLGQNLQLVTEAIPLPPVPVKSIRVNQTTLDGRDLKVPFQVEDWASGYTVPLGLTNNATVFGSRQMIVFLVNTQVTKFTIWWNGSDEAPQTPLAFTNTYFTGDNPDGNLLTNGRLTLQFGGSFTVTSTVFGTTTSSTTTFMRINQEPSVYGANPAYVISRGIVRDIVQQEAEWSGGADNCPNLYANIVLSLPANATYFTYNLRLIFVNSAQTRTITNLCPIKLSSSFSQIQTENGTSLYYPNVVNGSGTFYNYNYPSSNWTAHHWSQFFNGTKGAGLMFTATANQRLYAFDSTVGSATGALKADTSAKTIELLPVAQNPVLNFNGTFDITWEGAVVTFDGTPPIFEDGGVKTGLWILAEIPPTITLSTGN